MTIILHFLDIGCQQKTPIHKCWGHFLEEILILCKNFLCLSVIAFNFRCSKLLPNKQCPGRIFPAKERAAAAFFDQSLRHQRLPHPRLTIKQQPLSVPKHPTSCMPPGFSGYH